MSLEVAGQQPSDMSSLHRMTLALRIPCMAPPRE